MAESEAGMTGMLKILEKYAEEKRLEVNVDKTKIMRCRKKGGRWKKMTWKWKGKEIEEVKSFKYLGYVVMANGKQKEQVRDRCKKAAAVMGRVWSIGKRRFERDWSRRVWLFDKLVWSVASYGVEIWGCKKRNEMESMQERFLKWVLGVKRYVPGYMVREELQREKLKGIMGRRACKMVLGRNERKSEKRKGGREMGIGKKGVFCRIRVGNGGSRKNENERIAKFRLGDDIKENLYWSDEENKKCRICKEEEETWKHTWTQCVNWVDERGWEEAIEDILSEDGKGEPWLKILEEVREEACAYES
ncbi:uncharacterized protein [Cardiocondyla obscurior]|uniref:uncharacterized protein n=1 Tax=Cardiocondyla obscurior TaxID=286306 RepID=UPI0039657785